MWRFLVTPPASGPENMALDEALMERARIHREWVLRVYGWSSPTISFGRNQTARGHYDRERIRQRGLGVVRRPTGGRAILHHREITYSVTAPVELAGSLRESYERINRLLVAGLERLGVAAHPALQADARTQVLPPGPTPCFAVPAPGELVAGERKLVGSAQWRDDGAMLQHGSILVGDDQSKLLELTLDLAGELPAPATLSDLLGRHVQLGDAAEALVAAVRALEQTNPAELQVDRALRARVDALVVNYMDDGWTWRR